MKVIFGVLLLVIAAMTVDAGRCLKGREDCICTLQYDPVCSTDGCDYSNDCFMKCAGGKLWYRGECKKPPRPSYYG